MDGEIIAKFAVCKYTEDRAEKCPVGCALGKEWKKLKYSCVLVFASCI